MIHLSDVEVDYINDIIVAMYEDDENRYHYDRDIAAIIDFIIQTRRDERDDAN